MAASLFEREAGGGYSVRSAGTHPSSSPSPLVEAAMQEVGVDLSDHRSRQLTEEDVGWADLVVIVGATRDLPDLASKRVISWDLTRLKHEPIERVRDARDEIHDLVVRLTEELEQRS
jgi:protein-tyrosine-phosphatase